MIGQTGPISKSLFPSSQSWEEKIFCKKQGSNDAAVNKKILLREAGLNIEIDMNGYVEEEERKFCRKWGFHGWTKAQLSDGC